MIGYQEKVYRDVLTEAYNRRYYEEELKQKNFAAGVAMLDLDDFKLYNDTFGHEVGDVVLKTTADVIRKNIRRSNTLIRYGGDEFLLILPDMKETEFFKEVEEAEDGSGTASIRGYSGMRQSVSIGGVLTGKRETFEQCSQARIS
ncbi:MAG: GGDEF domain-containing protein [Eubacterium ramulus]